MRNNRDDTSRREKLAVRLASLIVANAMLFQEHLSAADRWVEPLTRLLAKPSFFRALVEHWRYIISDIDYVPIFELAHRILVSYPADVRIEEALRNLAKIVQDIMSRRAALRHDLAGRIYHRLQLKRNPWVRTTLPYQRLSCC